MDILRLVQLSNLGCICGLQKSEVQTLYCGERMVEDVMEDVVNEAFSVSGHFQFPHTQLVKCRFEKHSCVFLLFFRAVNGVNATSS